jgi:hypothetical protein
MARRAWLLALACAGCAHHASAVPDQLDKPAIIRGMEPARPAVLACYQRYRVPGMVLVGVEVATDGRVLLAKATGQFSNTPTGDCVAAAVKEGARLSPFKGPDMRFKWPWVLQ